MGVAAEAGSRQQIQRTVSFLLHEDCDMLFVLAYLRLPGRGTAGGTTAGSLGQITAKQASTISVFKFPLKPCRWEPTLVVL